MTEANGDDKDGSPAPIAAKAAHNHARSAVTYAAAAATATWPTHQTSEDNMSNTQYLKWEAWPSESVPSLNVEAGAMYTVMVEFVPPQPSILPATCLKRQFSRQMVFEYTWAVGQAILYMQEHILSGLLDAPSEKSGPSV